MQHVTPKAQGMTPLENLEAGLLAAFQKSVFDFLIRVNSAPPEQVIEIADAYALVLAQQFAAAIADSSQVGFLRGSKTSTLAN